MTRPFNRGTVTLHMIDQTSNDEVELPDYQNLSYTIALNDLPVISFSYPLNGVNGLKLAYQVHTHVIIKIDGQEPFNHRFFVDQGDYDMAFDQNEGTAHVYAGMGIAGRLHATKIYPSGGISSATVTGFSSNERVVGGTTLPTDIAWNVIKGLWTEAEGRAGNAVKPLLLPGTLTHDSLGYAWLTPKAVERVVTVGTSLWDLIKKLADEGHYHVVTSPITEVLSGLKYWSLRLLEKSNPAYFGDKSETVIFKPGTHTKNEHVKIDTRNVFSTVLGEGANRRLYESRDSTAENIYFRRETYESNTGLISDTEISQYFSTRQSKLQSYSANNRSFDYIIGTSNDYVPGLDFDVGQKVSIDDQRYIWLATSVSIGTVVAYTVTVGNNNRMDVINVELTARLTPKEDNLQQSVSNIENGTTEINHGPITVNANGSDTTTSSTSYTDTGTPFSLNFTVPRSGKVLIIGAADASEFGGANSCWTGFRISGAATIAANDYAATRVWSDSGKPYRTYFTESVTGLPAGKVLTVTMQHRMGAATGGFFAARRMTVVPVT